jgi:hypothetical protein
MAAFKEIFEQAFQAQVIEDQALDGLVKIAKADPETGPIFDEEKFRRLQRAEWRALAALAQAREIRKHLNPVGWFVAVGEAIKSEVSDKNRGNDDEEA